jgi:hypothetical protein
VQQPTLDIRYLAVQFTERQGKQNSLEQ